MTRRTAKRAVVAVDVAVACVNLIVVFALNLVRGFPDPFVLAVLALGLSSLLLVHRKFPVPALLVSLVFIDVLWAGLSAATSNPDPGLIVRTTTPGPFAVVWILPATVVFVMTVLRGRWRWAVVLGAAQLAFAGYWQPTRIGLTAGQTALQLVVEGLWLAAIVGTAAGLSRRTQTAPVEPASNR